MFTATGPIYSIMADSVPDQKGSSSPPEALLTSEAKRTKKGNEPPGASSAPKCAFSSTERKIGPSPPAPSFSLYTSLLLLWGFSPSDTFSHTHGGQSSIQITTPTEGLQMGDCLIPKSAFTISLFSVEHLYLIFISVQRYSWVMAWQTGGWGWTYSFVKRRIAWSAAPDIIYK